MKFSPAKLGYPSRWEPHISELLRTEKTPKIRGELRDIQDIEMHWSRCIPITAGDGRIGFEAREAAKTCHAIIDKAESAPEALEEIGKICDAYGVNRPLGKTDAGKFARSTDAGWWVRQIRKEVSRRLEHSAIKLGFTCIKKGPYISTESAIKQLKRNIQNAKLLEKTEMENENGQTYKMSDLAALGPANKEIRRNELMVRIRGFEEIAQDCGHIGQFWTITCPSEFHSVGGDNENYNGATPREAQSYLVHAWALIRSTLARQGLKTYGFRIAEPHTDGCPHWHMLLFVGPTQQPESWHPPMIAPHVQRTAEEAATRIKRVITLCARAYMPHEKGAKKNRVKLIRIEAGKGTAAGYIAKYIAKNIDGECVGDHKTLDGYTIVPDMFGKHEIAPSQRVTYWSQVWGIRQFQQIGGAPIGIWRELRRIKEETVRGATDVIKKAWRAVQKIASDDPAINKQADFAEYVRVQGGPFIGRKAAIQMAKKEALIEGRYETRKEDKPCGVFLRKAANEVFESIRYIWKRKDALAVALPRTGVNNCTQLSATLSKKMEAATKYLAVEAVKKSFPVMYLIDWGAIIKKGRDIEEQTWKFSQIERRSYGKA
jgi:ribosomal protein S9